VLMASALNNRKRDSGPVWISDDIVARILTHDMAMAAVSEALACHARGEVIQPLKPYLRPKGREREREGGRFIAMPALVGGPIQAVGLKWISGFPANIDRGLPRASGVIVLNDIETGVPVAVMDCATISARRTAAVASLCVDLLGPFDDRRLALFGAGPINEEVLKALTSRPRAIRSVHIFDPRQDRAQALAALANQLGSPATCYPSAEACVGSANIIITATTGAKDYIRSEWLAQSWLIVALSLDDFNSEVLLSADKVICDDFDQCAREEKLLHKLVRSNQFSRERLFAELGEIIIGKKLGREGQETIYVNPMGMAIEDISTAAAVYRNLAGR
jgi:N-[(2S)-2-amino-2-carboxyethyl]-L-glutamate dehydrogenase